MIGLSSRITTARIQLATVRHFGLSVRGMRSQSRRRRYTWARHLSAYLTREMTRLTLSEIAETLNRTDHTTVLHSLEEVRRRVMVNPEDRHDLEAIREAIGEPIPPAEVESHLETIYAA